jgi:hypothetical protein
MRNFIPIILVAATMFVGCHSPSAHTPTTAKTAVVIPPFQPLLITNYVALVSPGQSWRIVQTSTDGTWRITVSEASLEVSRFPGLTGEGWPARSKEGATSLSSEWKPHSGWFVFAENVYRAWAYDGDRLLELYTFSETWNKQSWTLGDSGAGPFYGDQSCPVPAEVFTRLSEQARTMIRNHG